MIRKLLATLAVTCGSQAMALEDGGYTVWLEDMAGARIDVAAMQVEDGRYSVSMSDPKFTDHFLSMRPFKCLEGPRKMWCHVPYPYEIKRDLKGDLTDLEYDFLFLWKQAGSYGIDMWNGVYYVLEEQGDGLVGTLHEMDMNVLSVPPDDGNLRPVGPFDIEQGDAASHWLPRLVVTPNQ